jgi:hypothetical protein
MVRSSVVEAERNRLTVRFHDWLICASMLTCVLCSGWPTESTGRVPAQNPQDQGRSPFVTSDGLHGRVAVRQESEWRGAYVPSSTSACSRTRQETRSYTRDGWPRYIEVKATKLGALTPFYITSVELDFARRHQKDYAIYRVFDVDGDAPEFYVLEGDLDTVLAVEPVT